MISKENTSITNNKIQSKIYVLSENGRLKDSLIFSDSTKSLIVMKIIPTSYGYCLLGEMQENNISYFWNAKLNNRFNVLNQEFTPTNIVRIGTLNYTITKDSSIAVILSLVLTGTFSHNVAKINKQGVLVNYNSTFPFFTLSTNIFERNDSLGYLILNDAEWLATDTLFNITHRRNLDISRLASRDLVPTGLRKNDTTYYYFSRWTNHNGRRNRDLVFLVLNTLGQIKYFKTIEAAGDTNYTQGERISADTTKDGRFIYWGGTHNFDYRNFRFSLNESPFTLTKLDTAYRTVWQKKYGGKAYNPLIGVLATSDGGCVMYGRRYDYNNIPKTDAYIIKVDGNGIVTSETTIPITQAYITSYPNPSNGQVNFKKEDPSVSSRFELNIFDITGKLVFQKKETNLSEAFDLTHLAEGNYMYQIVNQGNIVSIGKWVKIK